MQPRELRVPGVNDPAFIAYLEFPQTRSSCTVHAIHYASGVRISDIVDCGRFSANLSHVGALMRYVNEEGYCAVLDRIRETKPCPDDPEVQDVLRVCGFDEPPKASFIRARLAGLIGECAPPGLTEAVNLGAAVDHPEPAHFIASRIAARAEIEAEDQVFFSLTLSGHTVTFMAQLRAGEVRRGVFFETLSNSMSNHPDPDMRLSTPTGFIIIFEGDVLQ
jgi:hypothetical protein